MACKTATLSVSSPTLEIQPIIDFLVDKNIESKVTPSTSIVTHSRMVVPEVEASAESLLIGTSTVDLDRILRIVWPGIKASNGYIVHGHLKTQDYEGCTSDYFN